MLVASSITTVFMSTTHDLFGGDTINNSEPLECLMKSPVSIGWDTIALKINSYRSCVDERDVL